MNQKEDLPRYEHVCVAVDHGKDRTTTTQKLNEVLEKYSDWKLVSTVPIDGGGGYRFFFSRER